MLHCSNLDKCRFSHDLRWQPLLAFKVRLGLRTALLNKCKKSP